MALIECVPNVSEGRSQATLDALAEVVRGQEGVELLDVDPGAATHRTVFTFVGEPAAVVDAAFAFIAEAQKRIDMRQHKGEHPRQGATDVCPLVPVQGITLEECAQWARKLGQRVGEELGIPIYLYEAAASSPARQNLADVRAGEYEALQAKIVTTEWKPDFGPAAWSEGVAKSGATQVGARPFLVAYNVNLNTKDRKRATDVALSLREAGRLKRDAEGKVVKDDAGNKLKVPGRLKGVKAVGWVIEEYDRAQISMNITDLETTPFHEVFDVTCEEAEKRGLRVTGSELVGLIPRQAIIDAGNHYLRKMGASTGIPESDVVRTAIQTMGLSEISVFDPDKKIVEYAIRSSRPLAAMPITTFVDELSSDSPAPGGGSVAALCGSLAASLASMVANLTHGKAKGEAKEELDSLARRAQDLKTKMIHAIDDDTSAFDQFLAARRLPKKEETEIAARDAALREAIEGIIAIPAQVVSLSKDLLPILDRLAEIGLESAKSDIGVSALALETTVQGAHMNVLINLEQVEDAARRKELQEASDAGYRETLEETRRVVARIFDHLRTSL